MVAKLLFGAVISVAPIAWNAYRGDPVHPAVLVLAAVSVMLVTILFYFLSQRKTPVGDLKVKVGDKLLGFEAVTSEGARFHTDELMGKRTLLKFFRGGW